MAEDQSASFIPKRNPAKKIKRAVTRRVYLFTFISYVLLFIALILSGVLFGYKIVLENRVTENIERLNSEISSFSVADMQKVVELDTRLRLSEERIENHLSTAAFLALIEASTVQAVQFEDMSFSRTADDTVTVNAAITTPDFDAAIVQREFYRTSEELSGVTLQDISFSASGQAGGSSFARSGGGGVASWYVNPDEGSQNTASSDDPVSQTADEPAINMIAVFTVDPSDIPFDPSAFIPNDSLSPVISAPATQPSSEPGESAAAAGGVSSSNQTDL